jgi:hypothetical protein
MANMSYFPGSSLFLNTTAIIILSIPITIATTFLLTNLLTTVRYRLALSHFNKAGKGALASAKPCSPPQYPYTIPILGHALSWTAATPGFFRTIQPHFSPNVKVITFLLAGKTTHIVNSPDLIAKLFRNKSVSREHLNRDILTKAMLLPAEDDVKCYGKMIDGKTPHGPGAGAEMAKMNHSINAESLLTSAAANALTETFMEVFQQELGKEADEWKEKEVRLNEFIREKMIIASNVALFGKEMLEMIPDFTTCYWKFDDGFLSRVFGVPRWVDPVAYQSCDDLLDRMEAWIKVKREKYGDEPSEDPAWDSAWGALVSRKRHRMYAHFKLTNRGMACFDLGTMFG